MRRTRSLLMLIPIVIVTLGVAAPTFASRAPQKLASALQFFQTEAQTTCRDIDRSFIQFDATLDDETGFEPGRVLSMNDGTLAVLLIVAAVDDEGSATAVDFATSVRVGALIIHSGDDHDVRIFDPAVRSGSGLRAPENEAIDLISFCYRVSIPSPPEPGTAEARPSATQEQGASVTPEPTATVLTLDLSGVQTASAHAAAVEATATAAAIEAANAIATSQALASEIAATATAAALASDETQAAKDATIAAQQAQLATLQANVDSAQATTAALQATLSAPTVTPAPTETPSPTETPAATDTPVPTATTTPTPVVTTVVYETVGDAPFEDWQPVDGWDLTGAIATTDGSGERGWVVVPVPSGLSPNSIVDVEFKLTGGEICPRNFGFAVRGSESGYYAAGLEWACDRETVLWAGSEVIQMGQLDESVDLSGEFHHLQISAIGSELRVSIDGVELIAVADDRYPTGNLVAFWTNGVGLEIRLVRVSEVAS